MPEQAMMHRQGLGKRPMGMLQGAPGKFAPSKTIAVRMAAEKKKGKPPGWARYSPSKKAHWNFMNEVRKYQKMTETIIARAPFIRVIREILNDFGDGFRVTSEFIEALQIAAEAFLTEYFEDMNSAAIHAGRITVMEKDSVFVTKKSKPAKYARR